MKRFIALLLCTIIFICSFDSYRTYGVTENDLQQANEELDKLKKELSDLSSDLSDLTTALNDAGAKLNEIDNLILEKQAETDRINNDIDNYNREISNQYSAMSLRIKYLYENSSSDVLELIFEASDMSDLLNSIEYVAQISAYNQNKMDELNTIVADCDDKINELNTTIASLNSLKAEAAAETEKIKTLIAAKKEQISISSDKVDAAEKLALAYEKAVENQKLNQQQSQINNNPTGSGSYSGGYAYDETDVAMLAAIIECEAGNQSYQGMIAVGNVVMNRVSDSRFPNSIYGVLYSPNQFTPVASGRFAIVLARGAKEACVNAAKDALNGVTVVNALYFHMYRPSKDFGGTVIGDHVFY